MLVTPRLNSESNELEPGGALGMREVPIEQTVVKSEKVDVPNAKEDVETCSENIITSPLKPPICDQVW